MLEWIRAYPYFSSVVFGLAILGVILLFQPWARGRIALASGLMAAPGGLIFGYTSAGYYWNPVRLGGLSPGIEDVLFTFEVGIATWVAATWRLRSVGAGTSFVPAMGRFLAVAAAGVGLDLAARLAGVGPSLGVLVPPLLVGLGLLVLRRDLWPLAASGSLAFPCWYFPLVALWLWLCPEYVHQWNHARLWGVQILGVPIEELTWAAAGGLSCPVFVAFVLNAKWTAPAETA